MWELRRLVLQHPLVYWRIPGSSKLLIKNTPEEDISLQRMYSMLIFPLMLLLFGEYGKSSHMPAGEAVRGTHSEGEVCLVLDGRAKTGNGSGGIDVVPPWSAPLPEFQA
ncbi:hypothetical protein SRHO_G00054410 [Serrasalmus rhombeus]